jgi:molybdopterin synthase catalytic subunit
MIEISDSLIDTAELQRSLINPAAGGYCAFEGWVRNENEGHVVERLEYEAYKPLAITEGEKVLAEARAKFPYLDARCVHRVGLLEIGECAVWIGVASAHRDEAFDARCVHRVGLLEIGECAVWIGVASAHRDEAFKACRYIIDEIKVRLPIWKKEHYANGDSGWVNCERCAQHGIAD